MSRETRKYLLSLCLLTLYTVFQVGASVFPHSHILNGEKLVHSHPYSNANHNHTSDQAVTIARLSYVQTIAAESAFSTVIERPVLYDLEFDYGAFFCCDHFGHCISLRAPPFC